jgi:8-oxo-dGTP pyrophosphatase MutT (NUDIX family)
MTDNVIKKVSAGGVLVSGDKCLVIKWISQNTIELPKGTIEQGETPQEACVREVAEETGYNARVTSKLNTATFRFKWKDGNDYEKTVHYFLMERIDNNPPAPKRSEGEDFENMWVTFSDAINLLSFEDMREAVSRARFTLGLDQQK